VAFTDLVGVRVPLVQAPMANNQPPLLAAAVSEAGGLGSVPGAALSPDELRAAIREVRAATGAPFAVNLFAPPYMDERAFEVVLEERPAVFSFAFGLVPVAPLREAGVQLFGTATTVAEARALAEAGVDAVVAQGTEAGGHRGTFIGSFDDGLVPLAELVPAIVAAVSVPVVAAGAIVDRRTARAALDLGADAVQVGTAFLFTPECARPREHLEALRTYDTVVTDAYTGRPMRAARTPVVEELMAGPPPLPYPEQRYVSRKKGPLYMGGTSARDAREQSAAELVQALFPDAARR
jgi:nitronate monooxygenase